MGRYDLRPAQVLHKATKLLETKMLARKPPWFDAIAQIPPGETLVRPAHRFGPRGRTSRKKPSRMFQPLPISFPEDRLRNEFYSDHPWELARPKVVVENSGNDSRDWDWSKIEQAGKNLDGESVVQRQLWLMEEEYSKRSGTMHDTPYEEQQTIEERAYDKARKEFYKLRLQEDVEREVAKEEALHFGSYFEPSENERSLKHEDVAYEFWKQWAHTTVQKQRNMNAGKGSSDFSEEAEGEDRATASELKGYAKPNVDI